MKDYIEGKQYFIKIRKKVRGRFDSYVMGHTCPRICDIEFIFERYDIKIEEDYTFISKEGKQISTRVLAYKHKHNTWWITNNKVRLDLYTL